MDKEIVLQLLNNIKDKKNVGVTNLEAIDFAIANGLLGRNEMGNFKLSPKGEDVLNGILDLGVSSGY